MKEEYNWKSLFAALAIVIIGVIFCLIGDTPKIPWISIGCSLIASGLVILIHDFFIEKRRVSLLDEWKLKMITSTRAEINNDCEMEMEHAAHQVDIVAFGLRSFRTTHTDRQIQSKLRKGVNYRILTMDPKSPFVSARENEENNKNIKSSIEELVSWADKINQASTRGKVIIKGYASMTLDFYWRVDNALYVGPYWVGYESQQTITYKYVKSGKGFRTYSNYFEKLWNDPNLSTYLTKETKTHK